MKFIKTKIIYILEYLKNHSNFYSLSKFLNLAEFISERYGYFGLSKFFLKIYIAYLLKKNNKLKTKNTVIFKDIKSSNFREFNSEELKNIYKYHLNYGKFSNALIVKDFYYSSMISEDSKSLKGQLNKFKVLNELGSFKEVINNFESNFINDYDINNETFEVISNSYLLNRDFQKCEEIRKKYTSELDYEFFNLISGKNIAIVGPGQLSTMKKKEINSFDVIIYLNNILMRNLENKILISYYNCEYSRKFKSKIVETLPCLSAACFKLDSDFQILKSDFQESLILRKMKSCNSQMLKASIPNMIQYILYDLLWFPSKIKYIKLFATDFFTAKNLYSKEYPTAGRYENKKTRHIFKRGIRLQDPFSNINFVNSYYSSKLIDIDNDVKDVLQKSLNEYALILDKRF